MEKVFEDLHNAVNEVAEKQEERERLKTKITDVRKRAMELHERIFQEYTEKEKQIDELIKKAETENTLNKSLIVQLEKERMLAELNGNTFLRGDELNNAKITAAAYPQTVEALQQLKNDIVVSADDIDKMQKLQTEWQMLKEQRNVVEADQQKLLLEIRENKITDCFVTFEKIPGLDGFLDERTERIFSELRKESL